MIRPLAVLFSLTTLTGCTLPFTAAYDALVASETQRMSQRNAQHTLQTDAIAAKVWACMYGKEGSFSGTGSIGAEVRAMDVPRVLIGSALEAATDHAEQVCTQDLINTTAVANPEGAAALAALLQTQHYALMPAHAAAAAQADPHAMASVRF